MATARKVQSNILPRFEHGCDRCLFLGSLDGSDLYYCRACGDYIRRYGSEDWERDVNPIPAKGTPLAFAHVLLVKHLHDIKDLWTNAKAHAYKTTS